LSSIALAEVIDGLVVVFLAAPDKAAGSGGIQPVAVHLAGAGIGQVLQELDEELDGGK
jgi:hypothetical protein